MGGKRKKHGWWQAGIGLMMFATVFGGVGFASDLDIMDKQRILPPEPKSMPKKVRITEDPKDMGEMQGIRFVLDGMDIDGATVFTKDELLSPYRHLYGTQVTVGTLLGIGGELTKKYRDAGYILSRVVLPEQEASADAVRVRFRAIEGYIASIEYEGDAELIPRFAAYFEKAKNRLLSQKPQKPLDYARLEREMLLVQDVPGIKVSSRFKEADHVGGTILVLTVEKDIFDAGASWGNTGTHSSGPGIFSINMGLSTLPFIGSRTSLSYSQANKFDEYYAIQVGQSHRFANGIGVNGSYAYSASPTPGTNFARLFDYETESHTVSVGADYPLIRSRTQNLTVGLGFEYRDSDGEILGERYTKDYLRNLSLSLNFDMADEWGGVSQAIATVTRGLDVFNATDHDPEAGNPLASATSTRGNLYLSRNQSLPRNFSLVLAAELQLASSTLASYNQYSLGGNQFGRGYDPGVLEDDNAFAASLEARWTHYLSEKLGFQPFAFIDWGSVWTSRSIDGIPDEENLSSVGLGVRLWGHVGPDGLPDFNLSGYVGKPLKHAGGEDTDPRGIVQVSFQF